MRPHSRKESKEDGFPESFPIHFVQQSIHVQIAHEDKRNKRPQFAGCSFSSCLKLQLPAISTLNAAARGPLARGCWNAVLIMGLFAHGSLLHYTKNGRKKKKNNHKTNMTTSRACGSPLFSALPHPSRWRLGGV